MTRVLVPLAWLFGLLFCPVARAAVLPHSLNPYQSIVRRNIFRLKPAAPPRSLQPPAPPLPEITLTGITTILGDKRVLLKVRSPSRPLQPPKEECRIMSEGQRDGELQVLKINVKAETVTVSNSGTVMVLNFQKNGPKPSYVAPPRPWPKFPSRVISRPHF